MAGEIVTRSCSVTDLFADTYRFHLPYFQRGYAWQEAHTLRLYNDVLGAMDGSRQLPWYPLGTIIIAKTDAAPDAQLTDGHQRLLTLTILIAILRDLEGDLQLKARLAACVHGIADAAGMPVPRLLTQSLAQGCLAMYVQAVGATEIAFKGDPEALSDSEGNIIANRNQLKRRLGALAPARRQRFARYLLEHCIIVMLEVESEDISRLLFATLHDTGIKPTPSDLFKSEVLGVIAEEHRETAQSSWEMLEAALGHDKIDLLLRQIAIIADRQPPKIAVEQRLEQVFDLGKAEKALAFITQRITPVGGHLIEILAAQLAGDDIPTPLRRRLRFLSWIRNHDTWLAPALHWLERNGSASPQSLEFLRRLEALAWTQMILADEPETRDQRYMALIEEISQGRALDDTSVLRVTPFEQAETRRILAAPNFIRRKYKQFLLLRIDAAMRGDGEALPPPIGTIEHIYPNRPAEQSQWRRDFKGREATVLRQQLGNLTLLTTVEQNEVKNRDFADKRPTYATSMFVVTRRLSQAEAWTPDAVNARTAGLIELIMRDWGLA